jgi:single-strand DNA-binding protein
MALPYIIINGHLTEDVESKPVNDTTVLNYQVASNSRKQNEQGEWVNASVTYLRGSVWGKAAENAKDLKKGDAVMITGELKQNSYEAKDGTKKTTYEIVTENIGLTVKKN